MENITEIPTIDFVLGKYEEKEAISCELDGEKYLIDFTSKDQSNLRAFFLAVLNKERKSKFHFKYGKKEDFSNVILEKVASEYVNALNKEIDSICLEIDEQTKKEQAAKDAPDNHLLVQKP